MLDIAGASLCIDLRQHLATPVLVETINPCLDLKLFAGLSNVGEVNCKDVGAINLLDVSALARGLVFLRDVIS